MTRTKKLVSVILAIVLAFSTSSVAFAAPATMADDVNPYLYMEKTEIIESVSALDMNGIKQLIVVTMINLAYFCDSVKFDGFDLSAYKGKLLDMVWNMTKGYDRAASSEAVKAVAAYNEALAAAKNAANVKVTAKTNFNVAVTKSGSQEAITNAAFKSAANAALRDAKKSDNKSATLKNGVSTKDSKVTLATLVKPAGSTALKPSAIKDTKTTTLGGYTLLEMTLVAEHAVFNGSATSTPVGNSALVDVFDATKLVSGFAKVSYADTVYTGTKVTATIDNMGRIEKLEVSAPFTTDYEGKVTIGSLMAVAMDFTAGGSYDDVYTFEY